MEARPRSAEALGYRYREYPRLLHVVQENGVATPIRECEALALNLLAAVARKLSIDAPRKRLLLVIKRRFVFYSRRSI
jgi:hypothetical protein